MMFQNQFCYKTLLEAEVHATRSACTVPMSGELNPVDGINQVHRFSAEWSQLNIMGTVQARDIVATDC